MTPEVDKIKNWLGSGSINLFGKPFAGKDTQGHILAGVLNAELLGGGDILRSEDMPERVKAMMITGELIPTNDYLQIVLPFLAKSEIAGRPLVLSSVGRWHGEEPGVLAAAAAAGHPLKVVIYLNASEQIVRKRWQNSQASGERRHRADDDLSKLAKRLSEFEGKTLPVIDFYRSRNMLIEVDGTLEPPEVTKAVLQKLAQFTEG